MHHETDFVLSRKQFAVDLSSLSVESQAPGYDGTQRSWCEINAVWYRRRAKTTYACIGTLRALIHGDTPTGGRDFLTRHIDGRYGGDCRGRWDGTRYWGAQEPETMAEHMKILRPMLTGLPAVPDGFDGWWTFQPPRSHQPATSRKSGR